MKKIKVLGTGCPNCKVMFDTVNQAVKELGIEATVEKIEDFERIIAYNVMQTPALVIDEKVVSSGRRLNLIETKDLINS